MTGAIIQIVNYLLAAALYTLIGRYVLSLFFKADSQAVIWRVFVSVTDPIVRAVRLITPRIVEGPLLVVMSIVWILALRMALFLSMALLYAK